MNVLNINFSYITIFFPYHSTYLSSQPDLSSAPSQYPLLIYCHPSSTANRFLIENHRFFIWICITLSLESTSRSISLASPVLSQFTSSSTCQVIFITVTTRSIDQSLTLSLQTQNLPFQQILSTVVPFSTSLACLHGSLEWTRLAVLSHRFNF